MTLVSLITHSVYMGQLDRIKPYTDFATRTDRVNYLYVHMAFKRSDNGRSMAESATLGGAVALSTSGYRATSG